MNEAPRTRLVAYSIAVLAPAVSLLVRWPLWPVLGDYLPHMTFLPAVAFAAYYGGFRPGLLATLLSALAADSFLLSTQAPHHVLYAQVAVGFCLFVMTGAILSGMSESLHRARGRIVADERQRSEQALREAENRFRQLAENIHEIFWMTDARQEQVLYISPSYEDVWGRTCQSLYEQPRTWIDSIHPDDRSGVIKYMEQPPGRRIHRPGVPNRALGWVRSLGSQSRLPHQRREWQPVSHRRSCGRHHRAQANRGALRESEQRWRSLTEALPQLVWTAMPDGACDYFSTQWTQHTGVPEIDLLGWQWMETLHPDDREPTRQFWTDSVAGRGPYDVEYRVRRTDGEYRWFKTRGVPIRDSEGRIFKWFGTCTDITDGKQPRKRCGRARSGSAAPSRTRPSASPTVTPHGRFLRVNEKYCEIVGYPREELLRRTIQGHHRTPTTWPPTLEQYHLAHAGRIAQLHGGEARTSVRTARSSGWTSPFRSSATRAGQPCTRIAYCPGHLRAQTAGGGAAPGQGGGRGGQPGQGRVPGQRQPRDPHAHERHPRHDRAGPRHAADRRPAAMPEDGQVGGRQPARHHQRPARLLQDRGRQAGTGPGRLLPAGGAGRHPADPGHAGPQEGAGAGLPRAAGRARRPGRRRRPAAAGAAQPGRQRHQVHRTGRGGRPRGSRRRAWRRRERSACGSR